MADKPTSAILRTYQVGFGDCFLLKFIYPDKEKFVLIDFGSTGLPDFAPRDQMMRVAEDIKKFCKGKLNIVVATHRHKDHISGFSTEGDGTGLVIASCKPDVVIQPWTENPQLDKAARAPGAPANNPEGNEAAMALRSNHIKSLDNMNRFSDHVLKEVSHFSDGSKFVSTLPKAIASQLNFLAIDNGVKNASAVKNLCEMSPETHYVHCGYPLDLEHVLPGVKLKLMGPPTVEQYDDVAKQRSRDAEEFWMLYGATADSNTDFIEGEDLLFPAAETFENFTPSYARWFVRKLRTLRAEQLLQIVRILDDTMNNTSVILLFEAGKQKLLFPGDAQIENWEYALKQADNHEENLRDLRETTLYKVGHHGSRNATPKTLWNTFGKKSAKESSDRLKTVVSTMIGKHGNPDRATEVPRQTLVDALEGLSDYYSTQQLDERKDLFHDIEIDLK